MNPWRILEGSSDGSSGSSDGSCNLSEAVCPKDSTVSQHWNLGDGLYRRGLQLPRHRAVGG